ncbi:MAG: chemotaxis protein CheW [Tuberibacillus sp.]
MAKYLVFELNAERFGLNIESILSIETMKSITWVPGTKDYLKGLLNIRGELTPIIDMRTFLSMPKSEDELKYAKIIIVYDENEHLGLLVDEAKVIIDIPEDKIDPVSDVFEQNESMYIEGIANLEDKGIGILNLEKIFEVTKELVY